MTPLQEELVWRVKSADVTQVLLAQRSGYSEKHISQMLLGRVEGSLTAWQALLDAAERTYDGCDCTKLCSMGPTCPGGMLAGLPDSGCSRTDPSLITHISNLVQRAKDFGHLRGRE